MLRSLRALEGCAIRATDGVIGEVRDCYFDDHSWVIRYLVVEAGSWLSSRKVLISPVAVGHPDWIEKVLPVSLTRAQVRNSPDIDTDRPVSRQHEIRYLGYYGYPAYWGGSGIWGSGVYPNLMIPDQAGFAETPPGLRTEAERNEAAARSNPGRDEDPHLRSCNIVMSYHVEAEDGDIGHVEDMLIDDSTWAIRHLVVNTSNWWIGHPVLVTPDSIEAVSWIESTVSVNLTRQAVREAERYDAGVPQL